MASNSILLANNRTSTVASPAFTCDLLSVSSIDMLSTTGSARCGAGLAAYDSLSMTSVLNIQLSSSDTFCVGGPRKHHEEHPSS